MLNEGPSEGFYYVFLKEKSSGKKTATYVDGGWTLGIWCDGVWSLIGSSQKIANSDVEIVGQKIPFYFVRSHKDEPWNP